MSSKVSNFLAEILRSVSQSSDDGGGTSRIVASELQDLPSLTDSETLIELFGGLEQLLNHPSLNLKAWQDARRKVYEHAGKQIAKLSREDKRRLLDVLATQNSVPIRWPLFGWSANAFAVLYNFSPFADTGSTVASKRLRQFGDVFDVFSCDHSSKKSIDETVARINAPYVAELEIAALKPEWATVRSIIDFADRASLYFRQKQENGAEYDYMYSRAMWINSHYAAARIKKENPELKWVAEFSDPLSLDVQGNDRTGAEPNGEFFDLLLSGIKEEYPEVTRHLRTVFGAAELVAFALADEIIFTNAFQKQVMVSRIESDRLRERVESRAVVSNHPTLPAPFYNADSIDYELDETKLNLAYFGEFYANRGLQDITAAMRSLPADLRSQVELHVFTDYAPGSKQQPRAVSKKVYEQMAERARSGVNADGLEDQVRINKSLPYLKFIGVTNRFDCLIVTDARSGENHEVNPYLPSKWSDYAGSMASSWALIEPGSTLSEKPATVHTPLDDPTAILAALHGMVETKIADRTASQEVAQAVVPVKTPMPLERLSQEEISDDYLESAGISAAERDLWERTIPAVFENFGQMLPNRSKGTPYEADSRRILAVQSGLVRRHRPVGPWIAQTPVYFEEPFASAGGPSANDGETFYYPYDQPAHEAVQSLAVQIHDRAAKVSAAAIYTELSPVVGVAALIAARQIGIPVVVDVNDFQQLRVLLEAPLTLQYERPIVGILRSILTEADLLLTRDPQDARRLAQTGYDVRGWLADIPVVEVAPSRPRVVVTSAVSDDLRIENIADVQPFEGTFKPEKLHFPDAWVVDLRTQSDRVAGMRSTELGRELWRAGRAGTRTIVLTEDGLPQPAWAETLKHADVIGKPTDVISLLRASGIACDVPAESRTRIEQGCGEVFVAPETTRRADRFRAGISLILPTYQGAKRIETMLDSIERQTIDPQLLELIVVPNGPSDGTVDVVKNWASSTGIDTKILPQDISGVAHARNSGLAAVSRSYVTFVDDDDYLGRNYLWSMFLRAAPDVVVLGKLNDVAEDTREVNTKTPTNRNFERIGAEVTPLVHFWNALSLNAAKLVPSHIATQLRYNTSLKSAEDQVYFVELLRFPIYATGGKVLPDAAYNRIKRAASISRRPESFEFNVSERLAAMVAFRDLSDRYDNSGLRWGAKGIARWHALAVVKFANDPKNSSQRSQVIEAISSAGFADHPEFKKLR